jgi:hypothetical protein
METTYTEPKSRKIPGLYLEVPHWPSLWAGSDGCLYRRDEGVFERKREIVINGYRTVRVSRKRGGRQVKFDVPVHRAVCMAFHGLPEGKNLKALHKDGVYENCVPDNLYWGTDQDNADDREFHRLFGKGKVRWGPVIENPEIPGTDH